MTQTDPNLVPGWNVQSSAPSPYTQVGITASTSALASAGNGTPGVAYPPSNNTSASNLDQILANPGYADISPSLITPGTALAAGIVPMPASGAPFRNPSALAATVVISGGTVTAVKTAPVGGTLALLGAADGTYTVPGGGTIELTYSAAPTWTWVLI